MALFPMFIDLEAKKCVVVGGGKVAARKVETLIAFGAEIIVVSPFLTDRLRELKENGAFTHQEKAYAADDLEGAFLAVAAASAVLVWLASYATARRTLDGWESFIASCAVTTAFGCGIYTGWSSLDRIRELVGPARNAGWMAPAVCGILAAAWASLDCAVRPPRPLVFKAAAAGAAMVYVGCVCLFARLAVDAERIARGFSPQTRRFACLCSTDLEEAREALMEYEKVGGFERRKAALRSFIEQEEGVCRLER